MTSASTAGSPVGGRQVDGPVESVGTPPANPEVLSVPTYTYACTQCGHAFDIRQSFTDDSLTAAPRSSPVPVAEKWNRSPDPVREIGHDTNGGQNIAHCCAEPPRSLISREPTLSAVRRTSA